MVVEEEERRRRISLTIGKTSTAKAGPPHLYHFKTKWEERVVAASWVSIYVAGKRKGERREKEKKNGQNTTCKVGGY